MLRGWADPTDSQREGGNIGWALDYEFLLIVGSGRAAILKSMGVWVEAHRKWLHGTHLHQGLAHPCKLREQPVG